MTVPANERRQTLLLAVAALNLFLLCGLAAGAVLWWNAGREAAQAPAQPRGLRLAAEALPQAQRERLVADLRIAHRANRDTVRRADAGRREVLELLQADPLDRADIDAALQRTRDADLEARAHLESTIVAFADTLTPEQRRALAEGLSRQGTFRVRPPAAAAPEQVRP